MDWELSWRTDARARELADRHYSRQTVGAEGFVPPGRCLVLIGVQRKAYWVTSWPFAEYVRHEWPGAWICSAFRNEGEGLSSDLIRQAVAATVYKASVDGRWGSVPSIKAMSAAGEICVSMVTFVDESKTRKKRDPGRCFRRAGFVPIGYTKGGLYALGLPRDDVPPPDQPLCTTIGLFE